jgi:hypothetical protein
MNTLPSFRWMGMFIYLMSLVEVSGQIVQPSQTDEQASPVSAAGAVTISTPAQPVSQTPVNIQAYQQEQAALAQENQALMAKGATLEQLVAWQQQNAVRFAAQQQKAEAMSVASAMRQIPVSAPLVIPANASQTLKDFLMTQASLANAHAQIHNQIVQQLTASGQSPTLAQISQMEQQAMQTFQEQHAADLQLQMQRAQALATASEQTVKQVPGPTRIPPNATAQLAAYLTARDQLAREQVQLRNQYVNADPATREAAMEQWQEQNAARFQQLQQQAQNLSQASTTTSN